MTADHQTTIMLSEAQQADWEEHISESQEFNSKADLVRRSVAKQIHGDFQQSSAGAEAEAISEVQREVLELRSLIEDLRASVDTIEARTREPSERIRDLTKTISWR